MPKIPDDFRRIDEDKVDRIFERHFSCVTPIASWVFGRAFAGAQLQAIQSVRVHRHKDHRRASGDPLAHGETDVEVIATLKLWDGLVRKVGLLIENKVDADEMENQGARYQARALYESTLGAWEDFACVLIAPLAYLEAHYPLGDARDYGWDQTFSYQEFAARLPTPADREILLEATKAANAWNKPIPSAVQFWKDYASFGRVHYPGVPVFVETQKGSRIGGVWPSFYDNELRRNPREPGRKRIQIVHVDTATHVALYLKKVAYSEFVKVTEPMLEPGMVFAPAGGSWQSLRLTVPTIDPCKPLQEQVLKCDAVFHAAQNFFEFFLRNEKQLLATPQIMKG